MASGEVTSKFGSFVDPHDLAVTSDAKEVRKLENSLTNLVTTKKIR
jgi:hypothetical protein